MGCVTTIFCECPYYIFLSLGPWTLAWLASGQSLRQMILFEKRLASWPPISNCASIGGQICVRWMHVSALNEQSSSAFCSLQYEHAKTKQEKSMILPQERSNCVSDPGGMLFSKIRRWSLTLWPRLLIAKGSWLNGTPSVQVLPSVRELKLIE